MPPFNLETFLSIGTTVLSVALVVAFLARNLRKEYPIFVLYCAFDAVASILFLTFLYSGAKPHVVQTVAYSALIARWPIEFYVVLELIDRVLTDHKGLARVGRYAVFGALGLAGVSALVLVRLDSGGHRTIGQSLRRLLDADQGVSVCLFVFLAVIAVFLWQFPVRLSFNTKAYYWGYSLFFLFKAAGVLVLILGGVPAQRFADGAILSTEAAIQLFWLIALKQRGTVVTPAFDRHWSAAKQDEVLTRLRTIERHISGSKRTDP